MYTIKSLDTIMDIVSYTVSAMRESAYIDSEIDDYIEKVSSENNYFIIQISKEIINDCNSIESYDSSGHFEDTWQDSYYSSLLDDDLDDTYEDDKVHFYNEEDTWRDSYYSSLWDDFDNTYTDNKVKLYDDEDVYEGFNSCGGRCDDSEQELKDYYNPEIHSKFEDDDF